MKMTSFGGSEYLSRYSHKVVSVEDLKNKLNLISSSKTIMCHGVFDVVHPGHLRHLSFAKSIAETLIVSVTSDSHIKKGTYRPLVPEYIRALNLAALEMVDYVLIDKNETPINNIKYLKPNFFAKGFEYSSTDLNSATREENDVVSSYGGQVVFTPGDLVMSSSLIISDFAPNLKYEKLLSLMQFFDITFKQLNYAVDSLSNLKIHVVGDTIVDNFTQTSLLGGQIKTPTISVKFLKSTKFIGGAAIVARHLRASGAEVTFTTVLGEDQNSEFVIKELQSDGIEINYVTELGRPTTEKHIFICDGVRMLKVDTVESFPCNQKTIEFITREITRSNSKDIVIFSDFRHGIFHKLSIPDFISAIPIDVLRVADSQVASRWGNICDFKDFDLITPNEKEARFSTADQDSTIGPLANKLYNEANCRNLILKLGSRGAIALMESQIPLGPQLLSLDSLATSAIDPVGAGDALIAYSSMVLRATNSLPQAMIIGSIAAACEIEIDGNVPISKDLVKSKISEIENSTRYVIK